MPAPLARLAAPQLEDEQAEERDDDSGEDDDNERAASAQLASSRELSAYARVGDERHAARGCRRARRDLPADTSNHKKELVRGMLHTTPEHVSSLRVIALLSGQGRGGFRFASAPDAERDGPYPRVLTRY